jgi:hypothetical protein
MLLEKDSVKEQPLLVKNVVYLAISFLCLFSAFNIAQNLVTEIFGQEGFSDLGQYCLFTIYFCFGLSSFVVAHVKSKLSHKAGMILGGLGYFLFLVAGLVGCYCNYVGEITGMCSSAGIYLFNIGSAAVLGFCAGILWLSEASYVTGCGSIEKLGYLNGLFWSICQCSQILGSLIAAFVLKLTNHFTFYIFMCAMAGLGILMFVFLPRISAPPQKKEEEIPPITESIGKFIDTFRNRRMVFLFPVMFSTGTVIAFYTTVIARIVQEAYPEESQEEINELTAFIFVAQGAAELIGGVAIGKIIDKFHKTYSLNLSNLLIQSAIVISFLAYYQASYIGGIFSGILWGFAEVSVNTISTSLIGSDFDGISEGFAMYKFFQCAGVIVGISLNILLGQSNMHILILLFAFIQLVSNPIINAYVPK